MTQPLAPLPPTDGRVFRTEHDMADLDDLCVTLTRTFASIEGVSPKHLHPPLATEIDPESLANAFGRRNDDVGVDAVSFTYERYRVSIYRSGEIVIVDPTTAD